MTPDSKQKTETEVTFWYVLLDFIDSEPFPRKQKQKQVCTSHIWMCDHLWHLWPKCDQICFAKNTKKKIRETNQVTMSKLWHFVTVANVSKGHTLSWLVQTLFLILFGIRIRTTPRLSWEFATQERKKKKSRRRSNPWKYLLPWSTCWNPSKFFKNQVETCRQNSVEITVCSPFLAAKIAI